MDNSIPSSSTLTRSCSPTGHEIIMKTLVVGDPATGKTSFCKRSHENSFSQHYKTSVGVDFKLKRLTVNNQKVRLQLWDIMGQDRFAGIVRVYYQGTNGVFLVYDVVNDKTFESILQWKHEIDTKVRLSDGNHVPVVLLGNKSDLLDRPTEKVEAEIQEFCKTHGFDGGFLISCKHGTNTEKAASFLASRVLEIQNLDSMKEGYDPDTAGSGAFPKPATKAYVTNGLCYEGGNSACC